MDLIIDESGCCVVHCIGGGGAELAKHIHVVTCM